MAPPRLGLALVLAAGSAACSSAHLADTADADASTTRDGGPPIAISCTDRELVVVDELPGVHGTSLATSGERFGVTYTYGRFESFVIVDGATGEVTTVIDDYSISIMAIGIDEGFVVVRSNEAIYFDREGARLGALALPSGLSVGIHGFLPLEDGGDRLYAWLADPGSPTVGASRLVSLPRTPDGAVESTSLVLEEPPLAFAAARTGRMLVIQGEVDPHVGATTIGEFAREGARVASVWERDFDAGFTAIGTATAGTDGWIVAGALAIDGSDRFAPRLARVTAEGSEPIAIEGAAETAQGIRAGLLVDPDRTLHAALASAYGLSAIDRVALAPGASPTIERITDSSYATVPYLTRTASGCHGVLVGRGASETTSESELAIRLLPSP